MDARQLAPSHSASLYVAARRELGSDNARRQPHLVVLDLQRRHRAAQHHIVDLGRRVAHVPIGLNDRVRSRIHRLSVGWGSHGARTTLYPVIVVSYTGYLSRYVNNH